MLLPLISRHAESAERDVPRYAAWANALRHGSLEFVPTEQRAEARLDLVWLRLREPAARVEDFGLAEVPADLVEEEFIARHRNGETPSIEEYARRFPDAVGLLRRRIVGGRYVKLRRLGRGAMGEVWEAADRKMPRHVALKLPTASPSRFREEMRLLGRLSHSGIVTIHDAASGESPFYAMRLVDGPTLAERIRGAPRRELLQRFVQLCEAVAHAHSRGVLHRDLKPGNVIAGDQTVLIDWGMACGIGELSCEVAGTPEYMAPEQSEGCSDERSDVFGLGAILYEILTGRPPLKRGDRGQRIDPPRRVPRALRQICLKALAREAAARHAGASDLAADVRRFLAAPLAARIWHAVTSLA